MNINNQDTQPEQKSLIITSSGLVNSNLYGDLGKILTSHIPISGRFAILNIIENAKKMYDTIYVTIDSSAQNLINFLKVSQQVRIIESKSTYNLDSNLKLVFENLINNEKHIDIMFGDSLNSDLIVNKSEFIDAIYVSIDQESNLFTSINRDEISGKLIFLEDDAFKNTSKKITGSFTITNIKLFKSIFLEIEESTSFNIFWKTWIKYDSINNSSVQLIEDINWSDIGHIDNYFSARRKSIPSSSRHFNDVSISKDSRRIIKSGPIGKIEMEKKWYLEIPDNLKKYTPHIFPSDKPDTYELEYISSIPLNEMWISENNDSSFWIGLRNQMTIMLMELHRLSQEVQNIELISKSKQSIYIKKFEERTEKFIQGNKMLLNQNLKINSHPVPSFDQARLVINEVANKISLLPFWSLIHGDLCFSNIIFDRRKNTLFLIDPRGSFGAVGIYGDPIYDLAKLSHSAYGDYDYFTSGLYCLVESHNNFDLITAAPNKLSLSRSIMRELIQDELKKYSVNLTDLRAIEAGLFMSAAILHAESKRGLALYLNGLEIMRGLMV